MSKFVERKLALFSWLYVIIYSQERGVFMLKRLNKKEVQKFIERFEIKCSSITLEEIQKEYFIIIDELIRFQIHNYDLIKDFI